MLTFRGASADIQQGRKREAIWMVYSFVILLFSYERSIPISIGKGRAQAYQQVSGAKGKSITPPLLLSAQRRISLMNFLVPLLVTLMVDTLLNQYVVCFL